MTHTIDISNETRKVTTNEIYSWYGARKGDTWLNPRTQKEKEITKVLRFVDTSYGAIWHELTFIDGTGAKCADNMGFGTILITGEKEIA
jgi:hypothetical protein